MGKQVKGREAFMSSARIRYSSVRGVRKKCLRGFSKMVTSLHSKTDFAEKRNYPDLVASLQDWA